MRHETINDVGFLAALLHGRRSRLAEHERLKALYHIRNLSDFIKMVFPEFEFCDIADFQRRLVRDTAREFTELSAYLDDRGASLTAWMATRFEVQNLKLLIRGILSKTSFEEVNKHLIPLPAPISLRTELSSLPGSVSELSAILAKGLFKKSVEHVLNLYGETTHPFFFEADLDNSYFNELLFLNSKLNEDERRIIRPVIDQEIDIFHLMLVMRGKYHYQLSSDEVLPFHVKGSKLSRNRLEAMIQDPDARSSVNRGIGYVIDQRAEHLLNDTPEETLISTAEYLAWKRFLRLSNHAFRESHMGLGAVVGYIGIRIIEVNNLIIISEAIRHNIPPDTTHYRLVIPDNPEVGHV